MPKKLTQAEFLAKAITVHGLGRYDYSQTVYNGREAKLIITCPAHGEFEQLAHNHLKGATCFMCARASTGSGRRLSSKEFITRSRAAHGDKYDYSRAVYVGRTFKVTIICPKHGPFEQKAGDHLRGSGCVECTRSGSESFIEDAYKAHGDAYDYSQTIYVTTKTDVAIICPHHGVFKQRPSRHLTGQGCPQCAQGRRLLSKGSFIEKARQVHGDKYDYSQANYAGYAAKLAITCPTHGLFEQIASDHLRGQGCAKCGGRLCTDILSFLEISRQIHGDRYDYSQAEYLSSHSNLTIICPAHGSFRQTPGNHLKGQGCTRCAASAYTAKAAQLFFEKASQVHGNKYDYSQVIYVHSKVKITIICPEHGPFEQEPRNHSGGYGCVSCANSAIDKPGGWTATTWAANQAGRTALLYVVRLNGCGEQFYKAGITLTSVKDRFRKRGKGSPYEVEPIALFGSADATLIHSMESVIKKQFKALRYLPNKPFGGRTECYTEVGPILRFLATQSAIQQIE
jgi:ssDNA-binding Zn-finger/Zn-ribbon topoisomerase 1